MENSAGAAYGVRLLVVIGFFIAPTIFLGFFLFIRGINSQSKAILIFYGFRQFRNYRYVMHNLLFVFAVCALMYDFYVLIYSFIDTYILDIYTTYDHVGFVNAEGNTNNQHKFFGNIVFLGFIFHALCFAAYSYLNLYTSNSYFAEKFRAGVLDPKNIKKRVKGRRFLTRLEKTYPKVYKGFHKYFLNIQHVTIPDQEREEVPLV